MPKYIKVQYDNFNNDFSEYKVLSYEKDFISIQPTNEVTKGMWTDKRLSQSFSCVDSGEGVILKLGKRQIKLDYSGLTELMLLLRTWSHLSNQKFTVLELVYKESSI